VRYVEEMGISVNEPYRKNLRVRITTLRELFTKSKLEFETMFDPLLHGFPNQAEQLIDAAMCVRD
jgi:hypothetical protein